MLEWMLAKKELAELVENTDLVTPTGYLLLGEGDAQIVVETIAKLLEDTAKAQARTIVKYIENNLFCLGTSEGYIVLKEAWEQFKKEVGLDG